MINDHNQEIKVSIYQEYLKARKSSFRKPNHNIEKIFSEWLNNFFILYEENDLPEESCMNLERWKIKHELQKVKKSGTIKKLLKFLISQFPLPRYIQLYGPIKNSFLHNLYQINLKTRLERQKITINLELKKIFIQKIRKFLPKELLLNLLKVMPNFFFYNQLNLRAAPKKVFLSLGHIYDYPWNLLHLSKKEINFVGYQHGGNYGEFKDNEYEKFENSFYQKFIHWGFGKYNCEQFRFENKNRNVEQINSIFWLGMYQSSFAEKKIRGFKKIFHDLKNFENSSNDFSNYDIEYLAHPKSLAANNNFKKITSLNEVEKKISEKFLVVIPYPGSTFFYQSIYQDIPFVLFFNDSWRRYFTEEYSIFLKHLQNEKKLFWWSEKKDFFDYLVTARKKIPYNQTCNKIERNYFSKLISKK